VLKNNPLPGPGGEIKGEGWGRGGIEDLNSTYVGLQRVVGRESRRVGGYNHDYVKHVGMDGEVTVGFGTTGVRKWDCIR